MRRFALRLLTILLVVVFMGACINKAPKGVIGKSKMEKILYDYHVAQAMAESQAGDNNAQMYEYVHSVFQKYGITEAEFDTSMVWYSRNSIVLYKMYERINKRLENDANALGANVSNIPLYSQLSTHGDTANVWNGSNFIALVADETSNIQKFTIKADTSYRAGDYYKLIFQSRLVSSQGMGNQSVFVLMQINYSNDSVYSTTSRMMPGDSTVINVNYSPQRADWKTKSIKVTFYMPLDDEPGFRVCCLSDIALVRFHYQQPHELSLDTLSTDTLTIDTMSVDDSQGELKVDNHSGGTINDQSSAGSNLTPHGPAKLKPSQAEVVGNSSDLPSHPSAPQPLRDVTRERLRKAGDKAGNSNHSIKPTLPRKSSNPPVQGPNPNAPAIKWGAR